MAFVPQNFIAKVGPAIKAAWLNGVDVLVNSVFAGANTPVAARAALTTDLPLEIANGGTAARTPAAARVALTADAPLEVLNGGTGARTAPGALTALGALSAASFTQVNIGSLIFPATATETAVGATVVQPWLPPLTLERYKINAIPGVTSMAAAMQFAVNVAKRLGGVISLGAGPYLFDAPIDATDPASLIIGITNAAAAVVTFNINTVANPFYVGQVASFIGVLGMTQINGLQASITAIGGSSGGWTITVAINSTGFSAYSSGGIVSGQNCAFAIIGQGRFKAPTNSQGVSLTPTIVAKHTGHVFDTTGSSGIHFENLSIASDNVTYPKTCFFLARNIIGASRSDRLINCYVFGPFSQTIYYGFGAEDDLHLGCQFYNIAADSNTSVFDITADNARGLTSTFTAIQTVTPVSNLDHKIFGGEYANLFQGSGATADVFRLEFARQLKIYGIWIDCTSKSGLVSGRSLFYIDGSIGPTQGLYLHDIDGEASTAPSNYGILVSNNAQTHSNFVVEGCWMPTTVSMLGGGVGATIASLTAINWITASTGPGIIFGGALTNPFLDGSIGTVVAASIDNFANGFYGGVLIQNNGEADLNVRDYSQPSGFQWKKIRNSAGKMVISACNDSGAISTNNVQFNSDGTTQMLGALLPVQETGAPQTTAAIFGGAGLPNNSFGNNGHFYLRSDTPSTVNQRLYVKTGGAWIGIL